MSMMWGVVVVIAGVCAVAGYVLATTFTGVAGDRIAAFTVGGLVTMITTSLVPFAYDKGGNAAGLWAVVGLATTLASA
jgi:ZIP family zinc transporter